MGVDGLCCTSPGFEYNIWVYRSNIGRVTRLRYSRPGLSKSFGGKARREMKAPWERWGKIGTLRVRYPWA